MEYTRDQVIEIIKHYSPELDGDKIITEWQEDWANKKLKLKKHTYPYFCYSFPIIIDEKVQAEVTLMRIHSTGLDGHADMLANKYLGAKKFDSSWMAFSHDTYLTCYLSVNKTLELSKSNFSEDFYCHDGVFKDNEDKVIKYKISYGNWNPDNDIEHTKACKYVDNPRYDMYWFDCGVRLLIEKKEIDGDSLGEAVNKRIEERRKNKIEITD